MYQITPTQFFSIPCPFSITKVVWRSPPARKPPKEPLALWRCDDLEDGFLLGAATLQMRAGHHVLAHLAVAEPARGQGLGAELLAVAEAQAVRLGAKELWLVGKVPTFTANSTGWKSPGKMPLPSPNASPVTNSRWTASQHYAQSVCPDENLKREPFRISCGTALFSPLIPYSFSGLSRAL